MQITVLGSGSRGNCTYLSTGNCQVLVDVGFGIRGLNRRFKEAGLVLDRLDAILVTHGHSDHVSGVRSILKKFPAAVVFTSAGTVAEVPGLRNLDRCEEIAADSSFSIKDITVTPFETSHDSAEPLGFRISAGGVTGALATDLGEFTPPVLSSTRNCDWLILESNHDEELLKVGPYPWNLKQRVLGSRGHLSNRALAEFLSKSFDGAASQLFLAHLSGQNNLPQLALDSASQGILSRVNGSACPDLTVHLTHQAKPSIVLDL